VTTSVERLTVNESRAVVEYAPSVTGAYAQFPDGSQALALSGDQPRRGYTVGDTETLGVWRYYTSRETRWDTLVQDSGTNSSARPSPLQPLQVHAYPSKTGAKTKHPARVTNVDGEVADPPTLPESIDVDVVSTPYTTSETVITTGQPAFLNKVDVEGPGPWDGCRPKESFLARNHRSPERAHPHSTRDDRRDGDSRGQTPRR